MASQKKRILVTGCFDIIHPGHIYLINDASKLGDVIVIVARDSTIRRYKKKNPIISENQRLEVVKGLKNVKEAVLGNDDKDFMKKALSLKPDIIILGPNQRISVENIEKLLHQLNREDVEVRRFTTIYDKYELNSSTAIKRKIKKEFESNKD